MPKTIFHPALKIITDLIAGQQIAASGTYHILWIKDHFEIRKTKETDKESFLIIMLYSNDINNGLTQNQWYTIERRLRVLIETGVIK